MAIRPGRRSSTVIDDSYNASPASMEAALAVLLAEKGKPRIAVLGDMLELGQLAHEAHLRVGRYAASADLLVVMGEHAGALREGALAAGMPPDRIHLARDLAEAVRAVEPYLDGAVVLVKASRGMALEGVVAPLLGEGQEAPPDHGEGTLH
jgi:UDP-N-acetylmuramoyl-tripeptide--D-alanyl-D-alanine ligase